MLKQNPTLIHLLHEKSFVSRAARKVPHCQKRDCHAAAFRSGEGHSEAIFNLIFYLQARPKMGAPNPHVGACGNPVLGLRHDARNAPSSNVHQKQWIQKRQQGHKHPWAELGKVAFGSPHSLYLSYHKNGHQTNRTIYDIVLRILRFLAEWFGVTKLRLFKLFRHCKWSAGVLTPPDSGKTPQQGHQNWHKTVVKQICCISSLLTESASHEIEALPQMWIKVSSLLKHLIFLWRDDIELPAT